MSTPLLAVSILSILLTVAAVGEPPELLGPCPGDVAEPNDTVATAYRTSCTTVYTSAAAGPTCIDPSGDVDYYAVDLPAGDVLAAYQGGGDVFHGLLSLYATDGVTLLDQRFYSLPGPASSVSAVVGPAGTYYLSLLSPTGETGQAPVAVRCRSFTTPPPPVGNTLFVVKAGANVQLGWERSRDINLDPPTSYDVWRALPTTNLYYEPVGTAAGTSFDAGPVASASGLILYRVRALNAIGPDGPPPSVVRFQILPDVPVHLDTSIPASTDSCALPNLHPQLPFLVTVSLADRFGVPLDGYGIDLYATHGLPIGTFCPPGPPLDEYHVTGTAGSAGPGRIQAIFSFSDQELTRNPTWSVRFTASSPDFGAASDRAEVEWP